MIRKCSTALTRAIPVPAALRSTFSSKGVWSARNLSSRTRSRALAILGVDAAASPADVKHAYLRQAKACHPDVSSSSEAKTRFQELVWAYEMWRESAVYPEHGFARSNPWTANMDTCDWSLRDIELCYKQRVAQIELEFEQQKAKITKEYQRQTHLIEREFQEEVLKILEKSNFESAAKILRERGLDGLGLLERLKNR